MQFEDFNPHRVKSDDKQKNDGAVKSAEHPGQHDKIDIEVRGAVIQETSNRPIHLQGAYISPYSEIAIQPGLYVRNQNSFNSISGSETVTLGGALTDNPEAQPHRPRFQQSMTRVQQYMRQVTWRPTSGTIGVPQTDEEAFDYIRSVGKAIADISYVLDAPYCQSAFQRFSESQWSSTDIHAMSHVIVSVAISLHERGATSIVFKNSFNPDTMDAELTFPQRMEWFVKLLRQFKGFCDMIMRGTTLQELLASAKFSYEDYCRQAEEFHRRMHLLRQKQQHQGSTGTESLITPNTGHTLGGDTLSGAHWTMQTAGCGFPQPPEVNLSGLDPLLQALYQRDQDLLLPREDHLQQQNNIRPLSDGYIAPFQNEDYQCEDAEDKQHELSFSSIGSRKRRRQN